MGLRSAVEPSARESSCDGSTVRSIHQRLRRETAPEHEALERVVDLTASGLSAARYRQVLRVFYGFYEPLEARVRRAAAAVASDGGTAPALRGGASFGGTAPALHGSASLPAFELRARAGLLAGDLLALGMSPADVARLPRCSDLPALTGAAQLGGCLYVLEGASLGGQLIARALARHDDAQLAAATAFFAGDGAQTGPRWKCVIAWLEQLGRAGVSGDELVASARATFDALARWLQLQGVGAGR